MGERRYIVTLVRDEVFVADVRAANVRDAADKARRREWLDCWQVDVESGREFRVRDVTRSPGQPRRGRSGRRQRP